MLSELIILSHFKCTASTRTTREAASPSRHQRLVLFGSLLAANGLHDRRQLPKIHSPTTTQSGVESILRLKCPWFSLSQTATAPVVPAISSKPNLLPLFKRFVSGANHASPGFRRTHSASLSRIQHSHFPSIRSPPPTDSSGLPAMPNHAVHHHRRPPIRGWVSPHLRPSRQIFGSIYPKP